MKIDNNIRLIGRIREKANDFIISELAKEGVIGIAPSHGDVIVALIKQKKMTLTEIANKINRDRSTVTTLVNKLIRLGYIKSQKNPKDNRSSLISLTTKGKSLKPTFEDISLKLMIAEYKGISQEERETFLKILEKILKNLS